MARNRKRAKERRARRPQAVSGRVTAREGAPSPLGHAAPDAELLGAQLAMGETGLEIDQEIESGEGRIEGLDDGDARGAEGLSAQEYEAIDAGDGSPPGGPVGRGGAVMPPDGGGAAVPVPGAAAPEQRVSARSRLVGFLEGSWRELQRVQWPDRRQTMQATAVVIGFVILAGVFLGVADTLASHLMTYILTGAKSVLAWIAIIVIVGSVAGWSFFADRRR